MCLRAGLSYVETGAPSVSASDSTFTKSFGADKQSSGRTSMVSAQNVGHVSPPVAAAEGDATSNPFDSKCSTVSAGLNRTCTSPPRSLAHTDLAADCPGDHERTEDDCEVVAVVTPASGASAASTKCRRMEQVKGTKETAVPSAAAVALGSAAAVKLASPALEQDTDVVMETRWELSEDKNLLALLKASRKPRELSALDLQLQQLESQALGFSDSDEGNPSAPACTENKEVPHVSSLVLPTSHPLTPVESGVFLPSLVRMSRVCF